MYIMSFYVLYTHIYIIHTYTLTYIDVHHIYAYIYIFYIHMSMQTYIIYICIYIGGLKEKLKGDFFQIFWNPGMSSCSSTHWDDNDSLLCILQVY